MNSVPSEISPFEVQSSTLKKYMYLVLGFVALFMAYVGVITPGIPFAIFLITAAWAFSKSSKKWHSYLYSHSTFGPFLYNWEPNEYSPEKHDI